MTAIRANDRSKQRDRALRNAAVGGLASRVIVMMLGLASFAVCARSLEREAFGVLATLASLGVILTLADLGIGLALLSRLAQADGRDDARDKRRLAGNAFMLMSSIGLGVTLVVLYLASTLDLAHIFGTKDALATDLRLAVQAFAIAVGLAVPASIGQQIQTALQRGAQVVIWMAVESVAVLGGTLVAAALQAPLWVFVSVMVGGPSLVRAVQSLSAMLHPRHGIQPAYRDLRFTAIRDLSSLSGSFFLLGIAAAVSVQSGVLIVSHLQGASAAAAYAVTLKLYAALLSTTGLVGKQYWPAASEAVVRGDYSWVASRFSRTLIVTLVASLCGTLLLVIFGGSAIHVWVGPELVPPWPLLVVVGAWTVYMATMNHLSYLLYAVQVIRAQVLLAIAATVGGTLASWYFTEQFGLYGPPLGGLLAHVLLAGAVIVFLARRELRALHARSNNSAQSGSVSA